MPIIIEIFDLLCMGVAALALSMPPPPPSDHPSFRLCMLERPFKVVQLKPDDPIPEIYIRMLTEQVTAEGRFISLTRTNEEVSIVRECSNVEEADAAWRCIKIAGPMDFGRLSATLTKTTSIAMGHLIGVTGVMCNFTLPLKAAGIPIFAVSTW